MENNSISQTIRNLIIVGVTLAFAPIVLEKIANVMNKDMSLGWVIIVLLAMTFLWLISWTIFGQEETELLSDFFPAKKLGLGKYLSYSVPLIFGILFGFLISSIINLKLYLIFAICITLLSIISDIGAIIFFKKYYDQIPPDKKLRAELTVKNYYFKARYIIRLIIIPILYFIIYKILVNNTKLLLHCYVATASVLILGELIIWKWRVSRGKAIEQHDLTSGA